MICEGRLSYFPFGSATVFPVAASTADEADLLHFFLETGFRNGETAHSEYSDITWGNLVLEAPGIKSHSIRRPGRRAILSLIL